MAGLLGDILSDNKAKQADWQSQVNAYGSGLKNNLLGLLQDPAGSLNQFANHLNGQVDRNNSLMQQTGWAPTVYGKTTATPEQSALAKSLMAEQGAQMGMAGVTEPIKVFRAGAKLGSTAENGGPTFFATKADGAKPFERNGATQEYEINPENVLDTSRGGMNKIYDQFMKETGHPAGYGKTYRPFWTAEYNLRDWLKQKGHNYDAIMFDEPTGIPSYAVYNKDAIKGLLGE